MTPCKGDLQDFKVMYLDFSNMTHVCWIARIPSLEEPDLCRIGTYPHEHFLQAIQQSPDTFVVTNRYKLSEVMVSSIGKTAGNFLLTPIVYESPVTLESYVFDDFESKVMLHSLFVDYPNLHICVVEMLQDTFVQDYDRAMKVVT